MPADLRPIPSGSWKDRPLDVEVVRTALWLEHGNMSAAARRLDCTAGRLANFIEKSNVLTREREVARRLIVDEAEGVILDQLRDTSDTVRRDDAARFVLTNLGKPYGWGEPKVQKGGAVALNGPDGSSVQIRWGDEDGGVG